MAERPIGQTTDPKFLAAFLNFAQTYSDFPGNITAPALSDPLYVPPYRGTAPYVLSVVLMVLAFLVVCGRLVVRRFVTAKRWDWDDYVIMPATLATFGFTFMQCWAVTHGKVGYHIYDLPPSTVLYSFKFQNLGILLFSVASNLTKISICIFTLRICQPQDKLGRRLIISTLIFIIITWFGAFFMTAFQCTPTTASWDLSIRLYQESNCASLWKDAVGWSVVFGVTDLWLIVLPLRFVYKLHLPMGKKIGLFLIFIVAGLATIVAFLKLTVLKKAFDSWDPTFMMYSQIELTFGLIAASLPAFGFILVRMIPERTSTVSHSSVTRRSGQLWADKGRFSGTIIPSDPHTRFTGDKRDVESLFSHTDDPYTTDAHSLALTWEDSDSKFIEQVARLMAPSEAMQKQMYQYKTKSVEEPVPERPAPARFKNAAPITGIPVIPEHELEEESGSESESDPEHEQDSEPESEGESESGSDEGLEAESESDSEPEPRRPPQRQHQLASSMYMESTSSLSLVIQTPSQSQVGKKKRRPKGRRRGADNQDARSAFGRLENL